MKLYHDFIFMVHNAKVLIKFSLVAILILFVIQTIICLGLMDLLILNNYEWMVIFKFTIASLISNIHPEYQLQFTNPDGAAITTTALAITQNEGIKEMARWVFTEAKTYFFISCNSVHPYPEISTVFKGVPVF